MDTLLLDRTTWDLCLDSAGNIAVASEPYALAQDAASHIRLFAGELWYDIGQGIPYFGQILGKPPSIALMKAQFVAAALKVPGVIAARAFVTSIEGRTVTGQIQITDATGKISVATF